MNVGQCNLFGMMKVKKIYRCICLRRLDLKATSHCYKWRAPIVNRYVYPRDRESKSEIERE